MDKVKVDFLKAKYHLDAEKRRPSFFGRLFLIMLIVTASLGAVLSFEVATSGEDGFGLPSLFSTIRHLVTSGDKTLEGEEDDRINILLLGVGGEGHDGPQLTDTIIFASVRPSTKEIGMMSIPRDMTVPIPGYGERKVNNVNAFAEQAEPGSGPAVTSEVLGDLFRQDIQYYVRVDFDGFAELIDTLGGIDVYVERSFTDYEYPTNDHEYQTIAFQEGWQHMDGETALMYVRSRHGNNGEASDFSRSRRQQKILLAVKDKVTSLSTLINPVKVNRIFESLSEHISTNLSVWEILRLGDMLKGLDTTAIANHVIDASEDSPLYATTVNGAYVLLPKNDDWGPIQRMAASVFYQDTLADDEAPLAPEEDKPLFVRVEIQNGTDINGLAFQASQLLQGEGYEVVKIGNAAERGYEHTVIYDLTDGTRGEELKTLQQFLSADVSMSASGYMFSNEVVPKEITVMDESAAKTTEENVDFLVILGESNASLARR